MRSLAFFLSKDFQLSVTFFKDTCFTSSRHSSARIGKQSSLLTGPAASSNNSSACLLSSNSFSSFRPLVRYLVTWDFKTELESLVLSWTAL